MAAMAEGPRPPLGNHVQQLIEDRNAEAQQLIEDRDAEATGKSLDITQQARAVLAEARQLHRSDKSEDAVEMLVAWLDTPGSAAIASAAADNETLAIFQAMLTLGCWLCNLLATRHLQCRRVARAFGYTRTCERWLAARASGIVSQDNDEIWLRLHFDCLLNSAELAQISDDSSKALSCLKECEKVQKVMSKHSDPEAVYLCQAEVLLNLKRFQEAATAAARAAEVLKPQQQPSGGEKKAYSLIVALSLEQAALIALGGHTGPIPARALRCTAEAQSAWLLSNFEPNTPGCMAAQALLAQMRTLHNQIQTSTSTSGSGSRLRDVQSRSGTAMRSSSLPSRGSTPLLPTVTTPPHPLPPLHVSSCTESGL